MSRNKELITVCCSYCNEKKIPFSENALNKESIQFVCPERVVDITISDNEKIYVYKRLKLYSFFLNFFKGTNNFYINFKIQPTL